MHCMLNDSLLWPVVKVHYSVQSQQTQFQSRRVYILKTQLEYSKVPSNSIIFIHYIIARRFFAVYYRTDSMGVKDSHIVSPCIVGNCCSQSVILSSLRLPHFNSKLINCNYLCVAENSFWVA